jgi:hypothetical protein
MPPAPPHALYLLQLHADNNTAPLLEQTNKHSFIHSLFIHTHTGTVQQRRMTSDRQNRRALNVLFIPLATAPPATARHRPPAASVAANPGAAMDGDL